MPEEWIDYQLMKRMRWDWEQLQSCPVYVRNYCVDFLQMEDEAQARAHQSEGGQVHQTNRQAWAELIDGVA